MKRAPSSALVVVAPVAPIDEKQSREMGVQLTAQHEKATGGMRDVLLCGAMMMRLRSLFVSTVDTDKRELQKLPSGRHSEEGGLRAWLAQFAPKVARASAYRFESVAMSAARSWTGLPAALAKKVNFVDLVSLPEADLAKIDSRLPKKQRELFDYASGFSQKALLDLFAERGVGGGNQYERGGEKGKRRSAAQLAQEAEDLARSVWKSTGDSLTTLVQAKSFAALSDEELLFAIDRINFTLVALRDWQRKPYAEKFADNRAKVAVAAKNAGKKKANKHDGK